MFSCGYGDRESTEPVLPVAEVIDTATYDLHDSPYSDSGVALEENVNEGEEDSLPIVVFQQ